MRVTLEWLYGGHGIDNTPAINSYINSNGPTGASFSGVVHGAPNLSDSHHVGGLVR